MDGRFSIGFFYQKDLIDLIIMQAIGVNSDEHIWLSVVFFAINKEASLVYSWLSFPASILACTCGWYTWATVWASSQPHNVECTSTYSVLSNSLHPWLTNSSCQHDTLSHAAFEDWSYDWRYEMPWYVLSPCQVRLFESRQYSGRTLEWSINSSHKCFPDLQGARYQSHHLCGIMYGRQVRHDRKIPMIKARARPSQQQCSRYPAMAHS